MTEQFNGLAPAEAERLAMLVEECAEVIQIVGKILRHGYESYHPYDMGGLSNRGLLSKEITDVAAVLSAMDDAEDIDLPAPSECRAAWRQKLRYSHHQEQPK